MKGYRNNYKGHMDNNKGGGNREGGGVGWGGGEGWEGKAENCT